MKRTPYPKLPASSRRDNKLGAAVHACNPSTEEAGAGRFQVWGQPGQLSKTVSQNKKFKNGPGLWLTVKTLGLVPSISMTHMQVVKTIKDSVSYNVSHKAPRDPCSQDPLFLSLVESMFP